MIDILLERMNAVNQEINGVTSFKEPPPKINLTDLPVLYMIHNGFTELQSDPMTVDQTHVVLIETLVVPITMKQFTSELTSKAVQDTNVVINLITNHYNDHRYLHTESLRNMGRLTQPITIASEGVVMPLAGHDGNIYVGTRTTITAVLKVTIPTTI